MEVSAARAARWPMCLAIAIEKTSHVRAFTVTSFAIALVVVLTYVEAADIGLGALRKALNPVTAFAMCEFYVLATAFVVLYPGTYAQAVIDEREGVRESLTIRSLNLHPILAEFAVGSRVAVTRLATIIVRDFALFMTVYILFVSRWLSLDDDPIDSGAALAASIQEMEGGVSVHSLEH